VSIHRSIVVLDWVFILKGFGLTVVMCFNAMVFGAVLGLVIGVMRTSRVKILSYISWLYVYIIRGTPLLMQLFLVYYGLPLLLKRSIPAYGTALTGLVVYASAYLAEIVKGGIQSVPAGQREAAKALGMTSLQEFRYVVFPQALKVIVPPSTGFFIALIKDSSLISAIGFVELTRSAKLVIARTFQPFTVYLVVALVYFLTCYLLSVVSRKIEWRLQN
jgi:His/Glu/Gln/Arg/opine family amino acid ABC transporter permease subunit